jgi:hypothetical protein
MDGLRAPLILHNTVEKYQYDHDIVVPFQGKFNTNKIVEMPFFVNLSIFGIQIGTTTKVPLTLISS